MRHVQRYSMWAFLFLIVLFEYCLAGQTNSNHTDTSTCIKQILQLVFYITVSNSLIIHKAKTKENHKHDG